VKKNSSFPLEIQAVDERQQALVKKYEALPNPRKAVLEVMAVIYGTSAKTNVKNALAKVPVKEKNGKAYSIPGVEAMIQQLIKEGLAEYGSSHFHCLEIIREPICRILMESGRFEAVANAVQVVFPIQTVYGRERWIKDETQFLREIRIGLYQKDQERTRGLFAEFDQLAEKIFHRSHPFSLIFSHPPDAARLVPLLPDQLGAHLLRALLDDALFRLLPMPSQLLEMLADRFPSIDPGELRDTVCITLAEQYLVGGRFGEAAEILNGVDRSEAHALRGLFAYLNVGAEAALTHFETAMKLLKKETRKRKIFFQNLSGFAYLLALIETGDPARIQEAQTLADAGARTLKIQPFSDALRVLEWLGRVQGGDSTALNLIKNRTYFIKMENVSIFFVLLCIHWTQKDSDEKLKKPLQQFHRRVTQNGYDWLAAESGFLLSRVDPKKSHLGKRAEDFFNAHGVRSIVDAIQMESRWKQALRALIHLEDGPSATVAAKGGANANSRMVWFLDYEEGLPYGIISPREQVRTKSGGWSKGRKIALKRLYKELDTFDFLTPQDRRVCECIERESYLDYGYTQTDYDFSDRAIAALAGHPLIFLEHAPTVQVEIRKGKPELQVLQGKDGKLELAFAQPVDPVQGVQLIRESPTRFVVIEADEKVRQVAKIIGDGIEVPDSGKKELLRAVDGLSALLPVQSPLEGVGQSAEEVAADATPHVFLRPFGEGLRLEMAAQPLSEGGPAFPPGTGGEMVLSEIEGRTLQARRDLDEERKRAEEAVAACPTIGRNAVPLEGGWIWEIQDPESCLELLMELRAREDEIVLHWPEGQPFRVREEVDAGRFFMRVQGQADWFAVSGDLRVDEDLVMDLTELLSAMESGPGRFIRLGDGQFLALTEAFRKRLEEMTAGGRASGKTLRVHPLATPSLEEFSGELGGFSGDRNWKAHQKRWEEARTLRPEVPSTFKGELREYQREGFVWMARLAHLGAGACLADDMGLGKTLQALALLLLRSGDGPALVVAPTSVRLNWESEARRFAPTLNMVNLAAGDREAAVAALGPRDVLLVSYGLLQQESVAELLAGVRFDTIVLDEAQAIKNMTTKRSQAAMNLNGGFRLITTGTPIENHLGELWNLFRFINPGLLGSLRQFNERFAGPIEKEGDRAVRHRLRKLIQPFILRRTKSQVLDELPERTDVLREVEPGEGELALYEALRQKALETLENEEAPAEGRHLRILAEIMKLRRASCNPRLVMGEDAPSSAKLEAFGEIVSELRETGHKALVFSQFTDHLAILREFVEKEGISYQYLDGSTPEKKRKARVDAFQRGEGDLFLISLKAGGLGLNLTAADYVIHMDPWWNPAVEDQASDRAHRIGQQRPVTVYRLVAKHTIEEKIVALHHKKRDLADSLLDGADLSGKMSAEELLRLIREG
jgi:superfamily II DNA or RNA helicase